MYAPKPFREERAEALHQLMSSHPFAVLVTTGAGGLVASHLPLEAASEGAALGSLRGHLARANPQWRDLANGLEAMAIFQGPQAYVSPSWYPSKQEHGRVVPTWNYLAVHAYGKARMIEEPGELRSLLEALTDRHEGGRSEPWKVSDAPDAFVEGALRAIVGFELTIERLEGVWKLSQNRSQADRQGVIEGLNRGSEQERAVSDSVATASSKQH